MSFPYGRWVAAIERRRHVILIGSVGLCLVATLALRWLRLDVDVLSMLPQGAPAFSDFKAFVADFGELDELLVLIADAPPSHLQNFADSFAARLAALDSVDTVESRVDLERVLDGVLGRYLYNYLPVDGYAELARRLTPAGIDAQVAADRAMLSAPFDLSAAGAVLHDPLGIRQLAAAALAAGYGQARMNVSAGYFAAPDGHALLVLVRPKAGAFDISFSERLMRQVRDAEAETRRALPSDGVRVAYTGSYVYALEDAATLRWDIARYTILALVGVLAVFYLGYRNLSILPFVTYPLLLTTLLTFALSLVLFAQLNAVSISFAAILYGLSIDSGIYFYTRLMQERRRQDLRSAITATLAGLGRANLAASTTTAVAFVVIGFSCLGAVSQLGFLTALGMLLTTVEFFVLFPALGFLVTTSADVSGFATNRLARLAARAAGRAPWVTLIAGVAGVALLFAARQVPLDVTLTHLGPRHSQARRVQHEIQRRFAAPAPNAAVLVRRGDLQRALEDSEAIAARLEASRNEGLLRAVQSVQTFLPSASVQRARLELYDQLPRTAAIDLLQQALARHGFVAARFNEFFANFRQPREQVVTIDDPALAPLRPLLDHYVRIRADEAIVATYLDPAPGISLHAIADRLHRERPDIACAVAARGLLEEELGNVLRRELVVFFALGLLGNLLLLLISFGSLATALAILLPVVLVVVALFAAMWLTGIAIDPINLIVTPLIFGIGVDYGVYIVARAREQGNVPAAIRSAGRAVVVTALTTVTGFGFLGLSQFSPLAIMGRLAAAGLFLCLALSVTLLPALLALVPAPAARRRDVQLEPDHQ